MPRNRSTFKKRQKEQQRQQKRRDKVERRLQRKGEKPEGTTKEIEEMAELRKNAEAQAAAFSVE